MFERMRVLRATIVAFAYSRNFLNFRVKGLIKQGYNSFNCSAVV